MLDIKNNDLPLHQRFDHAFREAIRTGQLKSGDRLPGQHALARQLGVDSMRVRHLYEALRQQGLIVSRHGSGSYVANDVMTRLGLGTGRTYDAITVVVGKSTLADCQRELTHRVTDMLAGVSQALAPEGVVFRYAPSFDAQLLEEHTDRHAVLIINSQVTEQSVLKTLQERDVPVLALWGKYIDLIVPRVSYDPYQSASLGPMHLIDCGYRRIGFIGDTGLGLPMGLKFLQFANVLQQHELDYRASHVFPMGNEIGRAYAAAQQLVRSGDMPEALVVDNDYKAMEVIAALTDAGVKVPEDIAIVGYDDIPEAASFNIPLSTVRTPRREIGRQAGQILLNWPGSQTAVKNITLPSELVVRQSTQILPAHAPAQASEKW